MLNNICCRNPVKAGTMASSPGPKPDAANERCKPLVQEVTAMECIAPENADHFSSNSLTFGLALATQIEVVQVRIEFHFLRDLSWRLEYSIFFRFMGLSPIDQSL